MHSLLTLGKQLFSVLFVLANLFATAAFAAGDVVLTLENTSEGVVVELTEDDLMALPQAVVLTENEFVDGLAEFSGPLARDVIALLNDPDMDLLTLTAINDYSVEVPVVDFAEYDVIFALFQNGNRFSPRDKGPVWVIYPMTDHEELQDRVYNDRLIWQLVRVSAL